MKSFNARSTAGAQYMLHVVLGLSVSLEAPSTVAVALVLTHAVLPKELWLADRELDLPWPMFGIPDTLHVDNGAEFHSLALARWAEEYGIRMTFRPPARPYFGGHIERLIGTVMGAVHLLPGTTFSNVAKKGDYPSDARAALTLSELERWLTLDVGGHELSGIHQQQNGVLPHPRGSASHSLHVRRAYNLGHQCPTHCLATSCCRRRRS